HGAAAHAHWWDPVAPYLAPRLRVLALDWRGHGRSEWPWPPAYRSEDFAAELLGVIDALGLRDVVVAGHSMGGHQAMAFAARHPPRPGALGRRRRPPARQLRAAPRAHAPRPAPAGRVPHARGGARPLPAPPARDDRRPGAPADHCPPRARAPPVGPLALPLRS